MMLVRKREVSCLCSPGMNSNETGPAAAKEIPSFNKLYTFVKLQLPTSENGNNIRQLSTTQISKKFFLGDVIKSLVGLLCEGAWSRISPVTYLQGFAFASLEEELGWVGEGRERLTGWNERGARRLCPAQLNESDP